MLFHGKMIVKSPIPTGKRKDTKIIISNMIKFIESQQFLFYTFYPHRILSLIIN